MLAAAFSLVGSDDRLRLRHPGTYDGLAHAFSPVGRAIAGVAGHPVLASVGGNTLVGPQGALPVDVVRPLLGVASKPALRAPLFAAIRLLYRAGHRRKSR